MHHKITYWSHCAIVLLLVQLQIEEVTRRLRTGELGIPQNVEDRWLQLNAFTNYSAFILAVCLSYNFWKINGQLIMRQVKMALNGLLSFLLTLLQTCFRSPSPEPIYNNEGKRLNTREYRTRKKLEDDRHQLIQQVMKANPDYKPPADYRLIYDYWINPHISHLLLNIIVIFLWPIA